MVMRRGRATVLILGACLVAQAQSPSQDWWNRVHATYEKAVAQGRPVAERFVRQFPKRFESLKQSAKSTLNRGQNVLANSGLEEKEAFAIELWRIRQSIDLATLLSPSVLKELTGLDVPTLQELKTRVLKTEKLLQSQIAQLTRH